LERVFSLDVLLLLKWSIYEYLLVNNKYSCYCSVYGFSCHEARLKFTCLQATKEAGVDMEAGADMKGSGVGIEEAGVAMKEAGMKETGVAMKEAGMKETGVAIKEAGMGMKGAGVAGILEAGVMLVVEGEEWVATGKGTEERC
jgi:hypothetical protein